MSGSVPVVPLAYNREALSDALGSDWEGRLGEAYRWMLLGRALDRRMTALQRQGRVGFYGASTGSEAVTVAAGLTSRKEDWVVPGLREQLIALVRGHPLSRYVDHLFANQEDPARGRQMPCHPTARDVHYVSMSSVVGTQITHAVGLALALQRKSDPGVVLAFFGDGATSANDFHAGLNFAALWRVPVVFACMNNQWAISVPVEEQTHVARLVEKAPAYGLVGDRVDGTDFVACVTAFQNARRVARSENGPPFLEFVVYRMTPHSSSDDPGRYQPPGWNEEAATRDPVRRLEALFDALGILPAPERTEMEKENDAAVRQAVESAERLAPPPPDSLLSDVFASGAPGG